MAMALMRSSRVLRQSRGGRDYDSRFGHRMRGTGAFAKVLQQRFSICCNKLGLAEGEAEDGRCDLFTPPQRHTATNDPDQIDLFS